MCSIHQKYILGSPFLTHRNDFAILSFVENKKPLFACFITVRTSSSRLPGKALAPIRGRTVIEHVIDRVKPVKKADNIILCTSTDPSDDILETIAKKNSVECFRGSLKDKLARWLGAIDKFNVDYFVEVDADDVLCDPELMDLAITQMSEKPCDLLMVPPTLICGASAMCMSADAIRRLCEVKDTEDTEYWDFFFTNSGLSFNIRNLEVSNPAFHNPRIRLTLDYPEDLELFRRIFDEFNTDTNTIPMTKIVELFERKPELVDINLFRHQQYLDKREDNKSTVAVKKV
ncbi:MAG: Acylneuraminate cytidylyltransferase [Parcubacteria group bacterium GW2011_GWA2_49_16]|uniref:Acylneuraminate cytidylyltransferase n=2 Tax=Parcubacteria group TaxID=1794811 RepID=A0A0G1ZPR8_9BACT|nr:MAG: Acylneuraminate cytidylyltransferase [Parcubacteria group bacterium GW2011_GWA2_49_16]KKW21454.1 MAG: Acylneuraminate cytidylyltransferase [Candidatus Adlerbacteria bacterium GW2011_GWC1_50_9]KKW30172.1 MAG: Acylneuraminate cytidylyltransferase [Candidatus Kaiserbacteria bacterium GW2011_GWC2_52_8b]